MKDAIASSKSRYVWASLALVLTLAGCDEKTGPGPGTDDGGQSKPVAEGVTLDLGPARVTAPAGSLAGPLEIRATVAPAPAPLPDGMVSVGKTVNIELSDPAALADPLEIELAYDDTAVDESRLRVLHYDPTTGYELASLVAVDTRANRIRTRSLRFSDFRVVEIQEPPPETYRAKRRNANGDLEEFNPATHGWTIANNNAFAPMGGPPGGMCAGMVAISYELFVASTTNLATMLSRNSVASTLALLAHTSRRFTVGAIGQTAWRDGGETTTWQDFKVELAAGKTDEEKSAPRLLLMSTPTHIGDAHAVLVYGYDAAGLLVYDPNYPSAERRISFAQGTYESQGVTYSRFTLMGRTELPHFDEMVSRAEQGFKNAPGMTVEPVSDPANPVVYQGGPLTFRVTLSPQEHFQPTRLVALAGLDMVVSQPLTSPSGTFTLTVPPPTGPTVYFMATRDQQPYSAFSPAYTVLRSVVVPELTVSLTHPSAQRMRLYVTHSDGAGGTQVLGTYLWGDKDKGEYVTDTGGDPRQHVYVLSRAMKGTVYPGDYVLWVQFYNTLDATTSKEFTGELAVTMRGVEKKYPFFVKNPQSDEILPPVEPREDFAQVARINVLNNSW